MNDHVDSRADLVARHRELKDRLAEAEEALRAIRNGEVDAIIVQGSRGESIYSLNAPDSVYRAFVQTMKEAALTTTNDGVILYCNGQFGHFVRASLHNITGHHLSEFLMDTELPGLPEFLRQCTIQPVRRRLVLKACDGSRTPVQLSAHPLEEETICMVATDLTELESSADMLRRRASQLQKLTLELSHAEERERKRISRILHDDLQQNLAALKLRLALLLSSASFDERTRRGMHEFGKVLEESIEATRNLSRELSPPLLPQNGLLSALEWLAASVKQRHGLEVTLESSSEAEPSFPAIASLLFQSVRELLFNIVKHSGVTSAHVSAHAVEDRISLIVSDHGRGFDLAAWRANLLSGSGIGLVGIEERINALGGQMEIESSPAQGCVVRLVMPRHAGLETVERPEVAVEPVMASLAANGMLQPPTEKHSSRRIRILLADDHTAMREGLASILRSEGDLEIVGQAADGMEAVRMAVDLYPDIILMDVSMPGMDGIKATIEVTKYLTNTRVIGLSMHEDPGISRSMREAGACAYLSKSSSPEEIVRAVRGALSH